MRFRYGMMWARLGALSYMHGKGIDPLDAAPGRPSAMPS